MVVGRALKFRQCFYRWKFGAEKNSVVDHHENEDGPTNVNCWNIRLRVNILSEMIQRDG
jgi:hypothetical protein